MGHELLAPGVVVGGNYEIEAVLGHGTYGAVYRATDLAGGRIALKIIGFDPDIYADAQDEFAARVEREIKALRRLNSSSVVRLHDWGMHGEAFYLAMEYVEGRTLTRLMHGAGRLPIEQAVNLTLEILRGLADAHSQGIVHRDLKPDNIMVIQRAVGADEIRILDFGVARLQARSHATYETAEGTRVFGTPAYMAPEQGLGKVSAQSDLYAVGTMLFEMLAGRLPFTAVKPLQLMLKKLNDPMPPVLDAFGIPGDVVAVVQRALARRPADRFADAQAMHAALAQARLDAAAPLIFGSSPPPPGPPVEPTDAPIVERNLPHANAPSRAPRFEGLIALGRRLFGTPRRRLLTAGAIALMVAAGALFLSGPEATAPIVGAPDSAPVGTQGGRAHDPFLDRLKRPEVELPP